MYPKLSVRIRVECSQDQIVLRGEHTRIKRHVRQKAFAKKTRFVNGLEPKDNREVAAIFLDIVTKALDFRAVEVAPIIDGLLEFCAYRGGVE